MAGLAAELARCSLSACTPSAKPSSPQVPLKSSPSSTNCFPQNYPSNPCILWLSDRESSTMKVTLESKGYEIDDGAIYAASWDHKNDNKLREIIRYVRVPLI